MHPRPALLLGSTLALACSGGPPAEPAPAKADATKVAAQTEPSAKVEPPIAAGTTVEAEPTALEKPAEPTTPATAPSRLRLVAVREGEIGLRRHRDMPVLMLEGEPVPLVGDAFVRQPNASLGLSPKSSTNAYEDLTLAFGGDLDGPHGAWVSTAWHFERSISVYATYQWMGTRWQPVVQGKGLLLAHYSAVVEREGAVLALQEWAADPAQDLWEGKGESRASNAYRVKVKRAEARVKPAWLRLAGAEIELPRIPEGMGIATVVTDERGTIFALAREPGTPGSDPPDTVLTWPLGQSDAVPVDAPDLDRVSGLGLHGNGEHTLITGALQVAGGGGTEDYLAVGHGGQWQRVTLRLPGQRADYVVGAGRASDGELWIALSDNHMPEPKLIWRKPVDGEWEPVPLPTITADAFGPSKGRVRDPDGHEQDWMEIERGPVGTEPMDPVGLVWAAGAVWIVGDLGWAYTADLWQAPRRAVLLSNRPGDAPTATLTPTWQILLERRNDVEQQSRGGP